MQHNFTVGYLLVNAKGNTMYRVVGSGPQHIDVIEYTGKTSEQRTLSLIKGEWYSWNNGIGQKVGQLTLVALASPNRIPAPVVDFLQVGQAESLIIKGTAYIIKDGDNTSISTPKNWQVPNCTIYNLDKALLCVKKTDRKSLSDRGSAAEFCNSAGVVTRLSEGDVWIMMTDI